MGTKPSIPLWQACTFYSCNPIWHTACDPSAFINAVHHSVIKCGEIHSWNTAICICILQERKKFISMYTNLIYQILLQQMKGHETALASKSAAPFNLQSLSKTFERKQKVTNSFTDWVLLHSIGHHQLCNRYEVNTAAGLHGETALSPVEKLWYNTIGTPLTTCAALASKALLQLSWSGTYILWKKKMVFNCCRSDASLISASLQA